MKNFKKVLSLVLAFAMVLSSMTISFAAEAMTQTEADALYDLGLFKGTSATDKVLNLEGELTREQAMKLMSGIFGWEEDGDSEFTDVAGWAQPAVAAAVKNGITNGIGDGQFGGKDQANGIQVVTWFLRALGYDQKEAYEKAAELGVDAGIITLADALTLKDAALRANLTKVAYNTLKATPVGEEATIIEKLVEAGKVNEAKATELGLVKEVVTADLKVEDVECTNLKELTVVFNKPVDKDSAEDEDNYDLDNSADIKEAKLQDDEVTVVLTMTAGKELKNQEDYKLTVEDVKDINEEEMDEQEIEFKSFDGELPKVLSIKFTGPKALEFTMSEPIKTADDAKITVKKGNSKLSVNTNDLKDEAKTIDGDVVKVELYTALKDGKDYTFDVTGIKDYADYANFAYEEVITYADVKELPVASVVDADQKVVKIEFSNPVKGLTPNHFYHTFTAWKALSISTDENFAADKTALNTDAGEDDLKDEAIGTIYVKFAHDKRDDKVKDYPLQAGDVEVHVIGDADDVKIKDAWDNELEDQIVVASVTADREAPTVTSVEATAKDEIEIKFSEEMNLDSIKDKGNYTIYDEDGKKVSSAIKGSIKVNADKDKVTLTTKDFEGKTITLEIKELKDASIYENEIEKYTVELTFGDKDMDGVARVEFKAEKDGNKLTGGTLYVVYKEDMNDTAVEIKNYQLRNGSVYTELENDIAFFDGNKIVEIELDKEEAGKILTNTKNSDGDLIVVDGALLVSGIELVIGKVEDAKGNTLSALITVLPIKKPVAALVHGDGAKLIEKDKVTLQIDQELDEISADDFRVTTNGTLYITPAGIDYVNNDDGALITFTLKYDAQPSADNVGIRTVVAADSGSDGTIKATKNAFGTAIAPITVIGTNVAGTVADEVKAEVDDGAVNHDNEATAEDINTIVVYFNEDMRQDSISYTDVTVEDRDVLSVVVTGKKLTINLEHKTYADAAEEADKLAELLDENVVITKIADEAKNVTEDLDLEIDAIPTK